MPCLGGKMAPVAGTRCGKVLARISPEVLAAKRCYESGQNPTLLLVAQMSYNNPQYIL